MKLKGYNIEEIGHAELRCPYCLRKVFDGDEMEEPDLDGKGLVCDICNKEFWFERKIEYSYNSFGDPYDVEVPDKVDL